MKRLFALILCMSTIALSSCTGDGAEPYYVYGSAMDTNVSLCMYGGDNKLGDACLEILYGMESELSVTVTGSKLYALNNGQTVKDNSHFYTLCGLAEEMRILTDGAYNPCVYPLIKLWGFTTGKYAVPEKTDIAKALELAANSQIVFAEDGIKIEGGGQADLGGIAKGYASDVLRDYLKSSGVEGAVISLGGNIVTIGKKPDGSEWKIGINSPKGSGSLLGTLSVGECAVVTSGSYFRNFTEDGKLYHHIIDPETGMPADNGLVSVTVVADDATLADGLSTAFFVMGMEKALSIAQSVDVQTIFVTENQIFVSGGLKEKFTPDSSVEGEYEIIYN